MKFKLIFYILPVFFYFLSSEIYSQKAITNAFNKLRTAKSDEESLKIYISAGDIYRLQNHYDSAFYYYEKASWLSKDSLSASHIANCFNTIGVYLMDQNSYNKAIKCFIKSLKMFEILHDKKSLAQCYGNIGIVLAENQEYSKALEFFNKSYELHKDINDQDGIVGCFINFGQLNLVQNNFDQAAKYFLLALQIAEKINSRHSLALLYDNIGCTFMEQGKESSSAFIASSKFKKANEYLSKALYQYRIKNDLNGEAVTLYDISTIYAKQKSFEKAVRYADSSLYLAKKIGLLVVQRNVYENLSHIYNQQKKHEKALEYYTFFKQINDSIFNLEKSKQVNELYIKYETEKKQNEIRKQNTQIYLLEKEKEVVKYKYIGLLIFILMFVVITLFVFISLKRRIKTNKQIYDHKMKYVESQKLLADTELENHKLQSIQLQNELKYKNQEITNLALHLSERNDFLRKIKDELTLLNMNSASDDLIQYLDQNLMVLEKEKREFEEYVENINKSFYIKLREKNSEITKNEERLAALLKLNLSSKEISTILNITSKSVDMSRYRLRKKLDIHKDENLVDYLNSI